MSIENFRHKGLERLFLHDDPRGVNPALANWRIIFRFKEGNAFDVDLIDYH